MPKYYHNGARYYDYESYETMSFTSSVFSLKLRRIYWMWEVETVSWETSSSVREMLNEEVGDHFDNDIAEAARLDGEEFSIQDPVLQTCEDGMMLDIDPIIGMVIEFET